MAGTLNAAIGEVTFEFESLLEALRDGIAFTDVSGSVLRVNRALSELLGLSLDELAGRSARAFFLEPEQFDRVQSSWQDAIVRSDTGPVVTHFRASLRRRGEKAFRAEIIARLTRRSDGTALGCIHVRDIEAECRAHEALLEVSDRLKTLVAASPLAIMLFDRHGVTHMWNPAAERTFGYKPEDVVGQFFPAVPDQHRAKFLDYLKRVEHGESLAGVETVGLHQNGTPLTIALWATRIKGSDGATHCLAIVADLSQRKHMEEELAAHVAELGRQARSKDDFLTMLSHELRNPLFPLMSAASLLREHADGSESTGRTLDIVDRQLSKLQRLVDDLLDISRIGRDKLDIRRELVSLGDVIEGGVQTIRPRAESKRHALFIYIEEGLWVRGDAMRLEQVVGNLLHNAVKYTNPGGRIELQASRRGDSIVVRVRDTGVGLSEEAKMKLFEPFVQIEDSRHLAEGGLGLGLALVRALVQLHGGVVSAHSEGLGRGSEFEMILPAASPPPETVRRRSPSLPPPDDNQRILLVDDNEDAVTLLSELMTHWGHEALPVFDGVAALQAIEQRPFDVAFIDIEMPGMSGHELARRIRALPHGKTMRLVAITGHGADSVRERSAEAGFTHHLVKPVDAERLMSILSARSATISPSGRRYD